MEREEGRERREGEERRGRGREMGEGRERKGGGKGLCAENFGVGWLMGGFWGVWSKFLFPFSAHEQPIDHPNPLFGPGKKTPFFYFSPSQPFIF